MENRIIIDNYLDNWDQIEDFMIKNDFLIPSYEVFLKRNTEFMVVRGYEFFLEECNRIQKKFKHGNTSDLKEFIEKNNYEEYVGDIFKVFIVKEYHSIRELQCTFGGEINSIVTKFLKDSLKTDITDVYVENTVDEIVQRMLDNAFFVFCRNYVPDEYLYELILDRNKKDFLQ